MLVRLLGFPGTLIAGDMMVWDRWRWLKSRLGAGHGKKLLEIGCGSGAFTIGAARLGYEALGLSWDQRNQVAAVERVALCNATSARFEVLDVRQLDRRIDLKSLFDVVVCFETIEHILDDRKLMTDMAACLKPGGRLLLTTPNKNYRAIGPNPDDGPFLTVEDGGHVRRGYEAADLFVLARRSGLEVDSFSFCSGVLSQKLTYLLRILSRIHYIFAWGVTFPFRLLPLMDRIVTPVLGWPMYSICMEARKPLGKSSLVCSKVGIE